LRDETGAELFESLVHHQAHPVLIDKLKQGKDCIVEEITYCHAWARDEMVRCLKSQVPDLTIKWICLENDLETANWNVANRPVKNEPGEAERHQEINRRVATFYTYPPDAERRPIHRLPPE